MTSSAKEYEETAHEDARTASACDTAAAMMRALAGTLDERNPHADAFRGWATRLDDQAALVRRGAEVGPAGLREVQ